MFFTLHLAALHAIETTESVQILIGKIYLSALLREKKDGGMCSTRVAKRVLREQKTPVSYTHLEAMAEQLRISSRAYSDLERGKYAASAPTLLFLFSMLEAEMWIRDSLSTAA